MCGICGQFHFGSERTASPELVRGMMRVIAHRGPDDEGCHFDGPLGLGFRRLSIIDLGGGHQPMVDREESVFVVFNGEIYNFRELRNELSSLGHLFRTQSDTEVLVHGYKQWGTEVFRRLNGMFGLAIWDARRRRLVLARDAAGIKLVYYHVDQGSVVFGSELRAVLQALPGRPRVDATAMNLFLRYRYVPSPLTLHEGIRKLAPGTMALFENGRCEVERWSTVDRDPLADAPGDLQAIEELLDLYRRATARHLISDVPVGLLLSGGVDSGLLLALMNREGHGWPTFTAGYGSDDEFDELAAAQETARILSACHTSLTLGRSGFEARLPDIVRALEEPVASSSVVLMDELCRRVREHVKVALVGQGPDELFAGYTRHLGVRYGSAWRRVPRWLRTGASCAVERLPRGETLKRGMRALGIDDRMLRHQAVFSLLPGDEIDRLFRDDTLPDGAGDKVLEAWVALEPEMEGCDELAAFQVLEIRSSLPDELLLFTDKLSMAHGLEIRVPYLDREIVEFARRLPARFKIRNGQRKWLHRRVAERFLPPEILRRRKQGFSVKAVDAWFQQPRAGGLGSRLRDRSSLIFEYLQPDAVQGLLADHVACRRDNHKLLYSLVVLEEWLRIDRCAAAPALSARDGEFTAA